MVLVTSIAIAKKIFPSYNRLSFKSCCCKAVVLFPEVKHIIFYTVLWEVTEGKDVEFRPLFIRYKQSTSSSFSKHVIHQ